MATLTLTHVLNIRMIIQENLRLFAGQAIGTDQLTCSFWIIFERV